MSKHFEIHRTRWPQVEQYTESTVAHMSSVCQIYYNTTTGSDRDRRNQFEHSAKSARSTFKICKTQVLVGSLRERKRVKEFAKNVQRAREAKVLAHQAGCRRSKSPNNAQSLNAGMVARKRVECQRGKGFGLINLIPDMQDPCGKVYNHSCFSVHLSRV